MTAKKKGQNSGYFDSRLKKLSNIIRLPVEEIKGHSVTTSTTP